MTNDHYYSAAPESAHRYAECAYAYRGETLRFSSSTDVNDLAANLARKMSLTAHELGDLVYVEVCAGMPRFLTLIEKPLDTNEFEAKRAAILNTNPTTTALLGVGAVGLAYVPQSLLPAEEAAGILRYIP